MSTETHPAVSDALREAVARWYESRGFSPAGARVSADALFEPTSPIASEIARLTGERDAVQEDARDARYKAEQAEEAECDALSRAEAAEAETARLRAERDGLQAIVLADDAKAIAEYEWERANKLADDNLRLTTALAEAEARGRRQGLEEAAAKAEGQLAYWRERMRAEKCFEDGVSEDGEAYTPIGDVAAWEGGYCNGRMGEAEWWIGALRSLATAPAETQKPETGEMGCLVPASATSPEEA